VELDRRTLNRTLLRRQLLLERAPVKPLEVVELLGGMQAQTPASPYLALWSRIDAFDPESLSQALADRSAVRIALQRSTIHLVSADACRAFRPMLAAMLARALTGRFRRSLETVDMAACERSGRDLVDASPRTFAELGRLLHELFGDADPEALAMGVRALVPLVQVPPRGLWNGSGQARHTSAEAWLGRPLCASSEPDELVRRYLRAFGPASVADMQMWSGLTSLSTVVERLALELRTFHDTDGRVLWDVADAPIEPAGTDAPPRFLPDYDNVLLGHADRSRMIDDADRELMAGRNRILPTVLIDGRVGGVWRLERGRDSALLTVDPFRRVDAQTHAAVVVEGEGLLALIAPELPRRSVRLTNRISGRAPSAPPP
jgi:hypothetical protein